MRRIPGAFFSAAWLVLAGASATAWADAAGEIGVQVGMVLPDQDLSDRPATAGALEPSFGLRGEWFWQPRRGWFADLLRAEYPGVGGPDDVAITRLRTGCELLSHDHGRDYQTFAGAGVGWLEAEDGGGQGFGRPLVSISLGQRYAVGRNGLVRWELRADHAVGDDGVGGRDLTTGHALVSWNWGIPPRGRDRDGDGVPDRRDDCPATPVGYRVDERGCPLDSDGDGVHDGPDRCPETPGGWPVDPSGCPLDSDGDGIFDGDDRCPATPAGAPVDDRGCVPDSDGDRVDDWSDRCPDTARGATVDPRGCPGDGDDDGVPNGIDQCPSTPAHAHVDVDGCPLDGDTDGVFDGLDRCPQTAPGVRVDVHGCPRSAPLFEEDRRTLVLDGVYFEVNRAELTPNSESILERVARSLLDWPEVRVEIGGHTDADGPAAYNRDLSGRRAEAVRAFLISRGVPADRMTAQGYGEERPIADNGTREGKARNRRVELTRLDRP